MKLRKKILMILFFVGTFLVFHKDCYAGTQQLNSLDYKIQLNADGSMDVVETWDIYVSQTNTLFKDFELDSSKYAGITNVKVIDMDTELELKQIGQEMYHVTKGCYYGLPISGDKFEIAWGVGLDNSSANRTYQISYTVQDIITVYNDCSELYWQFMNRDNGIPIQNLTGTIKLPQAVKDLESLKVWGHGSLSASIYKTSNDTVSFEANYFPTQTMLEVRIAVEEPLFLESTRKFTQDKLQKIITEETKWADEANRARDEELQRELIEAILVIIGLCIVYLIVFVWFFTRILKYRKRYKEMQKSFSETVDIGKYFRDIPREIEATPAQAAFLYYSTKNNFYMDKNMSHVFSSTLLDLCLKGYITFDCQDEKNIAIIIQKEDTKLSNDEKIILDLLYVIAKDSNTVTMKELKKYATTNCEQFYTIMDTIKDRAELKHIELNHYQKSLKKDVNSFSYKKVAYSIAILMTIIYLQFFSILCVPILIEWIICIRYLNKLSNRINVLTEKGETERQQWKALKKYMEDFSLLKDREIPDLVLWEKYLVYATVFGISDKVVKQLKVVYPQIQELDSTSYMYMFMSDNRFTHGFIEELNKNMNSVYSAYELAYSSKYSNDSSGSGSGGGFSSGGGGRCWRRPEWAEDNAF